MRGFIHESTYNETKEWYTPPFIFEKLGIEFDLDPCYPMDRDIPWIPAKRKYSVLDNGLIKNWDGNVWMNPPYGMDTPKWMARLNEHKNGIALVFSRTDTDWFHRYAANADLVCFIKGRLSFMTPELKKGGTAGAGSMLLVYGNRNVEAVVKSNIGQCYKHL